MAAEIIHRLSGLALRGIATLVLVAVLLGEANALSAAALAVAGAGFLWLERRTWLHRPTLLALLGLMALVLVVPRGGEWILGGWDPGVNVNQGLLVARTGGVTQPPDPVVADVLNAAPAAFSRATFGFVETFPGFPVNTDTGASEPYFYRATPAWIASLGMVSQDLALRSSWLLVAASILVAASLLLRLGLGPLPTALGALALGLQPMVLHHASSPASETMELVLSLGIALALVDRNPRPMLLGTLTLLATINRVSFLLLGAILLAVVILWDSVEPDRRKAALRHAGLAAGWVLGLAWTAWVTPEATAKINHLMPLILRIGSTSLALFVLLDLALLVRGRPLPSWFRWSALLLPAMPILVEFTRMEPWTEGAHNLPIWLAYGGMFPLALASAGLVLLLRRHDAAPAVALWLVACLLSVILHRHAADLYPWATKRWLVPTAILAALGAASLAHAAAVRFGPRGLAIAALAFVAAHASILQQSIAAWRATEYDGAMEPLRGIARHVQPDDLVVSDHFLWGTPLAMIEGRTVLNAEPLLRTPSLGDAAATAVRAAATDHGRRVLLLTSTPRGLAVLPAPFQSARELVTAGPVTLTELVQHRANRGYATREAHFRLTLWEWTP